MGNQPEAKRREFVERRVEPLKRGARPADIAPEILDVLVGRHATSETRTRLTESISAVRTEPYIDTVHAIVTTDFRALLSKIAVPTLVMVGEDDRVFPVQESQYLSDRIPSATLQVLPGVGHVCNLEAPEAFMGALRPFLDQHRFLATQIRP